MQGGVRSIVDKLNAYERRRKLLSLSVEVTRTTAVFLMGIAICMAVDFLFAPNKETRQLLAVLVFGIAGAFLIWRVSHALRRRSNLQIAAEVEKRSGLFNEKIIAALSLEGQERNWMVAKILQEAESSIHNQDFTKFVDPKKFFQTRKVAALGLALVGILALLPNVPKFFLRAVVPHANIGRPGGMQIVVTPGNAVLPEGTDVSISVSISPDKVPAKIAFEWSDGLKEEAPMVLQDEGSYRLQLGKLRQSVDYVVKAGRAESERYRISLAVPPRIESVYWHLKAPGYTSKPPEIIKGTDVQILAGTETTLTLNFAGEPIKSADLNLPDPVIKSNFVKWTGIPTNDVAIGLNYEGHNGVGGKTELLIKVVNDADPSVKIEDLNSNFISENEIISLKVEASDDIGLDFLKLHLLTDGGYKQTYSAKASQVFFVELGKMPLKTGERISVFAEARDLKGQQATSKTNTFIIANPSYRQSAELLSECRSALGEMSAQVEMFEKARDSYISLRQSARLAETIKPELLYLEENLMEATDLLEALATGLKKETNSLETKFLTGFGITLGKWALAYETLLRANLHRAMAVKPAESLRLLQQGRDITTWAIGGLRSITNDFNLLVNYLEQDLAAQQEAVDRARAERLSALIRAHGGWAGDADTSVQEMAQLAPGDLAKAKEELKALGNKVVVPDLMTASNALSRTAQRYNWGERLAELNLVLHEISKVAVEFHGDSERQRVAATMMEAWLEYLPKTLAREEGYFFGLAQNIRSSLPERTRAIMAAHQLSVKGERCIKQLQSYASDIEFEHPAAYIRHVVSKFQEEVASHRFLSGLTLPLGQLIVERLSDYRLDKLSLTQYAALLEGERHRSLMAYQIALGYSELGRDIGVLIIDPALATPAAIDKLRERASALLVKPPQLGVEIPENKTLLEDLARKAREAAERAEKRPELRSDLAKHAGDFNSNKTNEAQVIKGNLAIEEAEARKNFAMAESEVVKASAEINSSLTEVAAALSRDALDPGVPLQTLAGRAHNAALQLQNEIAIPAAHDFKSAPTPAKASFGKRVARLVYDQHQAAEILDKMVRAKKEIENKPAELNVESSPELATKTSSGSSQNRADSAGELAEQAAAEALAAIEQNPNEQSSYAEAAEILAKAAMHGRLAAASSFAAASGSKASTADSADVESDTGRFQGEGGRGMELAIAAKGIDQADWARLPDNIKRSIHKSGGIENFTPEMQEAIRAYFRKLARQ